MPLRLYSCHLDSVTPPHAYDRFHSPMLRPSFIHFHTANDSSSFRPPLHTTPSMRPPAILLLTPPHFALPRSPQQHVFDRAKRAEISTGIVEKVDSGAGKISVLTMHGAKGSMHDRMVAAQIAKDTEQSTGDLGKDDPIRKNIERIIAFMAAEAAKVASAILPSTAGSDPGQFIEPLGVCMHPTGGVLTTDNSKPRVQVFNKDGEVVR